MFLSGEKAVQPYSLIYRRAEIDSSDNECLMLCPWRYIGRLRFLDAVDLCPEARCLESITLCKQAISPVETESMVIPVLDHRSCGIGKRLQRFLVGAWLGNAANLGTDTIS